MRLVEVNEQNLRDQQDHLALAQARLKSGVGVSLDVVQAETAVASAILNLTVARTNSSLASANLAAVMGIDPRTPIAPASDGEPPPPSDDLSALADLALKRRPEVIQAQADIVAAQYGVGAAKTGNEPSMSAFVQAIQQGNIGIFAGTLTAVGAVIEWTPFDSGLTAGRVKQARAGLETSKLQLASAKTAVTLDVSQSYVNLKTAQQRVVTSAAELKNAQEALRLARGRYSAGVGIFLDVLDAQAALVTASTDQVNALYGVDQARVALAHALGLAVTGDRS